MNTRRKFLLQSSMATTALLAAKPFQTFAKITAPVTGFNNSNTVLLLHSNDLSAPHITTSIKTVKNQHTNVAVFNTGTAVVANIKADAGNNIVAASDYELFYKGNIKIGVLNAGAAHNSVDQLNSVATFLKKEKACDVVVCLSQLGFKNKSAIDDRALAGASVDIDVILGGVASNSSKTPYIVLNTNQQEVIISHSADTANALAQVALQFNEQKQKINIAF